MNKFSSEGDDDTLPGEEASPWQELGVPEPEYLDERTAPPVNRELLLRLVRGELAEPAARDTYRLVVSFASWRDAHAAVLLEESRRTNGPG